MTTTPMGGLGAIVVVVLRALEAQMARIGKGYVCSSSRPELECVP
jgi:hypothetical protein